MRLRLTPREDSYYDMFADSANNLVTGARLFAMSFEQLLTITDGTPIYIG